MFVPYLVGFDIGCLEAADVVLDAIFLAGLLHGHDSPQCRAGSPGHGVDDAGCRVKLAQGCAPCKAGSRAGRAGMRGSGMQQGCLADGPGQDAAGDEGGRSRAWSHFPLEGERSGGDLLNKSGLAERLPR